MGDHKKITVDGEVYKLRRLGASDSFRLLFRSARLLGPAARALALSGGIEDFVREFLGEGAKLADVLSSDKSFLVPLAARIAGEVVETIDDAEMVGLAQLLLLKRLRAALPTGEEVDVDDEKTLDLVLQPKLEKHGALHLPKIVWAAYRMNLAPTTGGGHTSPQPASETKG